MPRIGRVDGRTKAQWWGDTADAMCDAAVEVAHTAGATPDETVAMLAESVGDFVYGASRAVAVEALLEQAEHLIWDILHDTYCEQDEGRPVTTLTDLERMRRAAASFSDQARYLVQPRLAGSRWPAKHGRMLSLITGVTCSRRQTKQTRPWPSSSPPLPTPATEPPWPTSSAAATPTPTRLWWPPTRWPGLLA